MRYLCLLVILAGLGHAAPTPRQQALLDAAEALQAAVPLSPAEITYQSSRPGAFIQGDAAAGVHAGNVLCDAAEGPQGLVWPPGEPLTIELDLNSRHRLRSVRVRAGAGDEYQTPEASLEGLDRQGEWQKLGVVSAAPLDLPESGEYQRVRLVYPVLANSLWLQEIVVEAEDAALQRAADRFRSLAAEPAFADFGLVSQLAMALRVRRTLGEDRTRQERALTRLADFCAMASGVSVKLQAPVDAPETGEVAAQLVVVNRSGKAFSEGCIKLKLPPGWSAAPGKLELTVAARQTVRLPVTLTRTAEGQLTLLVTGLIEGTPVFMSRQD